MISNVSKSMAEYLVHPMANTPSLVDTAPLSSSSEGKPSGAGAGADEGAGRDVDACAYVGMVTVIGVDVAPKLNVVGSGAADEITVEYVFVAVMIGCVCGGAGAGLRSILLCTERCVIRVLCDKDKRSKSTSSSADNGVITLIL
eukprot:952317_1